ncbi:uncharacterized protein ACRADG_009346 [Cochliomyia hominivorax]
MSKNIILGLLILGICCNAYGMSRGSQAAAKLADVILKSTYAMKNNPDLTATCFQTYMPQINDLAKKYEEAYNDCLNLTAVAEEALKKEVQEDIDTMQNVTQAMCTNFEKCSNTTDSLFDLFQCYYNVAGHNIQSAYEVQNLSKDKMSFVQIREENIYYNQTLCTDKCSRIYVEESTKVHADLESCLAGKPITTTSTAQPDETTEKVETTVASEKPEVTTEKIDTAPVETTTKTAESS